MPFCSDLEWNTRQKIPNLFYARVPAMSLDSAEAPAPMIEAFLDTASRQDGTEWDRMGQNGTQSLTSNILKLT